MSDINYRNNILLITDDLCLAQQLDNFLPGNGFTVKTVPCRMVDANIAKKADLAILDCTDINDNGIGICREICREIPVIMISSRDDEYSIAAALDNGADDYITFPLRQWELLARIKKIIRRKNADNTILRHGSLTVDTVKGIVSRYGEEIFLSALEYRILLIFLSNKDRVLTRQQLLDEIWNIGGDYVNDNTLTVYIKRIREKIEENPATPQLIKTVRGKGYKVGD
ncbi:MAG: response regulator transcription factor [Oscillospiraceae bacterium]|nr:response regulator transcription factor [Oscillospiraceae bacterium]